MYMYTVYHILMSSALFDVPCLYKGWKYKNNVMFDKSYVSLLVFWDLLLIHNTD